MFDTNIFNRLLDQQIELPLSNTHTYYATHVQFDELQNTRKVNRRELLENTFKKVSPDELPTESFVLGIARLGKAKLSDGIIYDEIRSKLNALNNNKANNAMDAVIAETAIKNDLILVTEDKNLAQVMSELKGQVCSLAIFLKSQ